MSLEGKGVERGGEVHTPISGWKEMKVSRVSAGGGGR